MAEFLEKKEIKPFPVDGPRDITPEMIERLRKETGFKGSGKDAEEEIKRRMRIGRKEAE